MFRITKSGAVIGMTETPNYIKQQENGCFALCPEPLASGIVFEGAVYHLMGREALDGVETVMLEETDAGAEITKATETGGIMFVTMAEAGNIDDVTAAEHADLFSPWAYPVNYIKDQIRRHNGALYRCLSDHTSQADWTPDTAPSLWVGISDPAEEWPKWGQPVGAHDSYNTGDKVSHDGKHWISNTDGNVWEPGVYGWTEETADGT
ncbi:chitinase [Colidextribacter sp. OB.20]|mgnify:FL=1|uniref:carbohydrate-binding protein n=1 Tax=Colidextribacter sp. OB.20 TaxID=2304568 RepID=UPI00136F7CA3|nr:carbohydrate-binding protein [Colidextribacter sp. OB.20]NBI09241.1 chitinase [Colidextribacter sp. OB.20]